MFRAMKLLLVALAGAAGTLLRHGASVVQERLGVAAFPAATLVVNVVGCFALGVVIALGEKARISDDARLVLGVGLCGGFTTYSSFNAQALAMVEQGHAGRAALYVVVTLTTGALAGIAGVAAGRALGG